MSITVLGGGAVQELVEQLRDDFLKATGHDIHGTFGAVRAMKDRLDQGADCDVLILTDPLMTDLSRLGKIAPSSIASVGKVELGVGQRTGYRVVKIDTAGSLVTALAAADGVYVPDLVKSTAGAHVAGVLRQLGVLDDVRARIREFPNGREAMRQLSHSTSDSAIGFTQSTEIVCTPGVSLTGVFPEGLGLLTEYSAGVCGNAKERYGAEVFVSMLVSEEYAELRRSCGFQ